MELQSVDRRSCRLISRGHGQSCNRRPVPEICCQEDVKKLIWRSFRDFSFEPKCMPTSQRSLLGRPGAAFFSDQFSQRLKINSFTPSCHRVLCHRVLNRGDKRNDCRTLRKNLSEGLL